MAISKKYAKTFLHLANVNKIGNLRKRAILLFGVKLTH